MKYNISAVSYTNTKPLLFRINEHAVSRLMNLQLDIPADCARKLIMGEVDTGLVPVAVFNLVPNARIISDYCISSNGAVNSVFIFSKKPITQIKSLRPDLQSRTSNMLAQVLCKWHWQIDVEVTGTDVTDADARVLIGDRTFGLESWPYKYDLGMAWKEFTGLPFLYAAWIANKPIDAEFCRLFNESQKTSLSKRDELLTQLPPVPGFDMRDYLYNKLEYNLTEEKKEAMTLFLSYIDKLNGSKA